MKVELSNKNNKLYTKPVHLGLLTYLSCVFRHVIQLSFFSVSQVPSSQSKVRTGLINRHIFNEMRNNADSIFKATNPDTLFFF